jgi:hypothetical protein
MPGGKSRICASKTNFAHLAHHVFRFSLLQGNLQLIKWPAFAALVSPTGYSSQALGPGQQCINADYNPTLRLPDMVMLAAVSDFELCDPDMESRFIPGLISCAASLIVAFSVSSLTIPDLYYSTLRYFLTD